MAMQSPSEVACSLGNALQLFIIKLFIYTKYRCHHSPCQALQRPRSWRALPVVSFLASPLSPRTLV